MSIHSLQEAALQPALPGEQDLLPIDNQGDLRTAMGNKLGFELRNLVSRPFVEALCGNRADGRKLNLSGLGLTTAQLNQLDQLVQQCGITELDLHGNQLGALPQSIGLFRNLKWLDLRNNLLTELPEPIGLLKNLKWLDLRNNLLTELPQSIGQLENLTHLNLRNNRLTALPEPIGQLENLTRLDLRDNPLLTMEGIPQSLIRRLERKELRIMGWEEIAAQQGAQTADPVAHQVPPQAQDLSPIDAQEDLRTAMGELDPGLMTRVVSDRFEQALRGDRANGRALDLGGLGLTDAQLDQLMLLISRCGITWLDLADNQLETLPDSIGLLKNLTELDLGDNRLAELPFEIGELTNLTHLNLRGNQLEELPVTVGLLENLTELNLRNNRLGALPNRIGDLQNLTKLYLSGNHLVELPVTIGRLEKLTELNLRGNNLTALPNGIINLQNLTELDLYGNPLPEVGGIPQLLINRAASRKLTIIAQEGIVAQHMANGHGFALTHDEATRFESALRGDDRHGRELDLANLGLIDARLEQLIPLIQQCGITRLDLSHNSLKILPNGIETLTKLTELNLSANELRALPELGRLTSLRNLDLSCNRLPTLPNGIGNLRNLTKLNLSINRLATLPQSMGQLENLTELDLGTNKLEALPNFIGLLKNLTNLSLSHNRLGVLPDEIWALTNLTELNLSNNQLRQLTGIGNLQKLTRLDLANNQLPTLPESMGQLENLTWLDPNGNPSLTMEHIPQPLIDRFGTGKITIPVPAAIKWARWINQ